MTLGQKIKDIRKQMGISQEMLGEILNVSRQAITKWETDAGVPEVYNLQELAKVFGVPVDYFLSDKSNSYEMKQLNIDITKYRNNNEENVQIMKHFYSDEWSINYLSFCLYQKNPLVRYGTWILSWFSDTVCNAEMVAGLLHQIDNLNDNYYLISRNNMKLLALVTKNRLEVINISNKKIKNGNIFFNLKHFAYEEKMFQIHKYSDPAKINNTKHIFNIIKTDIIICIAIIVIIALLILIPLLIK